MRPTVLAALLLATSALAAPPRQRALVIVDATTPDDLRRAAERLEREGASLPLRMLPDVLIGDVPDGIEARVPGVRVEREIGPRITGPLSPEARAARRFLHPLPPASGAPHPHLLEGDAMPSDVPAPKSLPSGCDLPAATSSVLVGSVAIAVMLPESSGAENTEDWSNDDPRHPGENRQDLVLAKILQGCDELRAEHPLAGLTFTIEPHRSVAIPLEPILHSVPDRDSWIGAILSALGAGSTSASGGSWTFADDMRRRLGTDWAAVAYVADDLNDADNGFPPTGFPFAYALLGGPYLVMTYDDDGWGLDRMNVVFRHELGHVFGALDEYASAGNTCSATSGFLRVKNGNNDSGPADTACETNVACVMRGNDTTSSCAFTNGQLGIRDLDGDGIPDVKDVPPDSGFDAASPLIVATASPTLLARSSALPAPGENPVGLSFALARIASAESRVDGGAWSPLVPSDGSAGGRCEDFDVALTGLSDGWHDVEVRATNDVGIVEPTPAHVRLYVDTDCSDDMSEPDDTPAQAVSRGGGAYSLHRCAEDSDWSRFFLQAGSAVTVSTAQIDASSPLTLRVLDPFGAEVGRSTAVAGDASVAFTATTRGVYLAAVEADSELVTDYTLMIDAGCVDDTDEPDSPAPLGRESGPGSLRSRTLCAGDEDRYLISMQAGETLSASLAFDGAFGDLDLEILDPSGASVATSNGTGTSNESASVTPTAEGVHVVRVVGKTPSDRNVYDLDVAATGCVDDSREDDDDLASARPFDASGIARGATCGADEDWLSFTIGSGRLVRLLLTHDEAAGNLDLELFTAGGRRVARSTGAGGFETITTDRLSAGSYAARIVGTSAARVAWSLELRVTDPLLLFVTKDPHDALLQWNRSSQECFTLRESPTPADWTGAIETLVQEGDPSVPDGDRPIDDLGWRLRDIIGDGRFLTCWLVDPHDCRATLVGSTKTATPSPVLFQGTGTVPAIDYDIVLRNDSREDVFGATLRDDLPRAAAAITITAMPVGASDASLPPPAGANGTGQLVVTNIDVPAGQERTVSFRMDVSARPLYENPMIDNQATIETSASPALPPTIVTTDDPLSSVQGDETRVIYSGFFQQLLVHAFWHRRTDVDVVVVDPCGNVVGEHDMTAATCAGYPANVNFAHSCATPSPQSRYERLSWGGFPPPAGEYVVELSYPGFSPDDADCAGSGPDEVTVLVQIPGSTPRTLWRTITLEPGASHVEVLRFTI